MKTPTPPIRSLLGRDGDPPTCRTFAADVSVHFWKIDAEHGDLCLCGQARREGAP